MLRLWICGRFAGEFGGEPLLMPTAERALALIGWLALHPGVQARSVLAEQLWPDVPEPSARASLRTAVWAVRRSWGPVADRVLEVSRNRIGLHPGQFWVDALAGLPEADGGLLPGIDDAWADVARDEHRARRLDLLSRQAVAADLDGRRADAVHLSRLRCALAPLDEVAHRDLLTRLEAVGDHAGAVVAGREFVDLLRTELGVRPSPATRAARSRLRVGPFPASPVRLYGRSPELSTLGAAWKAAADGEGQVVVLTGEAGIGKTSLLAELARRVDVAGGRTAVGAGIDVGGETPFAAWLELARALVGTAVRPPAAASWPAELSRLSPELGSRLGHPDPPAAVAAPELERLRVFESVLRLVEWSCADRPALIGLDDAHSADRASLRLTAHIGRRLAGLPVLLVLTRRDRPARPDLDALLADLAGRGIRVSDLDVAPIKDGDVAALASATLPMGLDTVRQVVAAAEGNPLLAVESTRALAMGGSSPPPNLRTAVRASIGRLPGSASALARLLAAAGRPLANPELDRLGTDDLAGATEAGIDSGLLVRHEGRLGFRHALLREAVYADLADPATLHGAVATALDDGDAAQIAHHLTLAGRPAEAAAAWASAAARARSMGALAEAADFLTRATGCAPQDGRLWLELEEVLAWQGRGDAIEHAWQQALQLLPPGEVSAAWCRRGRQLRAVICHPEGSFAAYRQAEALLDAGSSADLRAQTLIGLSWSQAVAGDAAAVDDLLDRALSLLPGEPDPRTAGDIAEIRIQGLIRQGRFTECAAVAASAGPAAVEAQLPERAYAVWINAACALACADDYAQALELADHAVSATQSVPVLLVPCLAARAHLLSRLGRHEEAARTVQQQRDHAERLDDPGIAATAAHDAGLVALAAGRYLQSASLLGEAMASPARISRSATGIARAEALARSGDADAATRQLRTALLEPTTRADQPWSLVPRVTAVQGLIAAARGDAVLAEQRYREAAAGWRRLTAGSSAATGEEYLATLVDLGRPPVVGLIDPALELAKLDQAYAALTALTAPSRAR